MPKKERMMQVRISFDADRPKTLDEFIKELIATVMHNVEVVIEE